MRGAIAIKLEAAIFDSNAAAMLYASEVPLPPSTFAMATAK